MIPADQAQIPVPLELIGGLYTEATPETIPLGASPCALNCDFILGSNLQRPGLEAAFAFDTFLTFSPKVGQSVADPGSTGEVAWANPTNIENNVENSDATASLNVNAGLVWAFDQSAVQAYFSQSSGTFSVSVTPTEPAEWGLILNQGTNFGTSPTGGNVGGGAWPTTAFTVGIGPAYSAMLVSSGAANPTAPFPAGTISGLAALCAFFTDGQGVPTCVQSNEASCAGLNSQNVALASNTTVGNTLIAIFIASQPHPPGGGSAVPITISDTQGNTYGSALQAFQASRSSPVNEFANQIYVWTSHITQAASLTLTAANLNSLVNSGVIFIGEFTHLQSPLAGGLSQLLQGLNYNIGLNPSQQVLGLQVKIGGHQTSLDASSMLTARLFNLSGSSTVEMTTQLPSADTGGFVTLGTPTSNWGYQLTPALLNDPNFGIELQASSTQQVTFGVYTLQLVVWLTPFPAPSFRYLKTFAQTDGDILNMTLGSDGVFYVEDAINDPGQLTASFSGILPNSYAQSATVDDREFIAISNLLNGTNIPMKYTPGDIVPWTRLTQVGPGAPPSVTSTSSGSAVLTITQQAAFTLPTDGFLLQSDSPSDHGNFGTPSTPGNVFTVVYKNTDVVPSYLTVGSNIFISGFPTVNGNRVNNDPSGALAPPYYTITSIGQPITGQTYYDAFTFTVNFTTFYNPHTPAGCTVQATLATMTTAVQVPNLEVGDQFSLTGTGGAPPGGYDSTWQVLSTPNASNLLITSTELLNNVAIYGFVLQTGTNPVVGEAVTVTLTNNGNGIFNVTNAIITAASPGTFSLSLPGANIATASETGAGLIFGTIFTFDAFAVIGNKSGGTVVSVGVIATGQRMCCYSFLTEDGFVSKPSPTFTFDVVGGASKLAVANLLTGPPNVIARIVHFTPANGAQFYNIENPVTVTVNGVSTTYTSTIINDNTSTNVTFSFTDTVLLAGQEIDIEGYNLFENFEIGACTAVVPYAQRLFIIGEQNKVFNLLNYSFDGGIGVIRSQGGSTGTFPAGWTPDPTNFTGGSVVTSPLFGNSYSITNTSGITQSIYGMITQPAFQDEDQVPIIASATTYSVRVTAALLKSSGPTTDTLIVDLFSPSIGNSIGIFAVALTNLTSNLAIYTGTLLTQNLAQVPVDLLIRIYVTNFHSSQQVIVDRIEVFPTEAPNLNGQVIGSYQEEFEQFDRVTGIILCTQQNQQPVTAGFTFGSGALYLMKTGSMVSVVDNPSSEPSYWNQPRVVSPSVGAPGPYCVTSSIDEPNSGEQWAVIVNNAGGFLFQGQQPIKLSEEIQSVINQIYDASAYTMWVRNDIINRRVLWGVPLNQLDDDGDSPFWLPAGKLANPTNPTSPNAVLAMNYKSLNTAGSVTESVQIHRSYSGKLIASDIVRKWAIWTIQAPAAAFLERADTSYPLFFGNSSGTGKIYELVPDFMEDDGVAIDQLYFTAGFVPTETGQGLQMGVGRYTADYLAMVLNGLGPVAIVVYPNTLDTPYALPLTPNLTLPASTNGDVELPVNEVGNRMFFSFESNQVGAAFQLARVVLYMSKDPWSPVRGQNG